MDRSLSSCSSVSARCAPTRRALRAPRDRGHRRADDADVSPPKWHLGHAPWYLEAMLLARSSAHTGRTTRLRDVLILLRGRGRSRRARAARTSLRTTLAECSPTERPSTSASSACCAVRRSQGRDGARARENTRSSPGAAPHGHQTHPAVAAAPPHVRAEPAHLSLSAHDPDPSHAAGIVRVGSPMATASRSTTSARSTTRSSMRRVSSRRAP